MRQPPKTGPRGANGDEPGAQGATAPTVAVGAGTSPGSPSFTDLEIGMPLTGRCNLAEGPLLQLIGDLQWKEIGRISGVPSKQIHDEDGARLYATFFFAETRFAPSSPMAALGENDRLTVASDLSRFGMRMLEGRHYLLPEPENGSRPVVPASPKQAKANGVPFIRLANSFVRQWQGAGWLKKARPVNEGIQRISKLSYPPVSYLLIKKAERYGGFFRVPDGYVRLHGSALRAEYDIVPDRDLNGVGLLYFANYPLVLDICERQILGGLERFPFSRELLDRRTVVHRRSAYYSNATADERLSIEMEGWIRNPFVLGVEKPEVEPIELHLDFKMTRGSDRRLMMISSVKKVLYGTRLGDTDLLDALARQAPRT